ncbi:mediator of DNA damage checkpoint protein 1-like [Penaeus chinensis]|uniref:mediator of DNA damage checkpoint protein 1-like n=1 Tax=Penaeus chinensis TaxID=139456 RepID=UPI001FB70C26|nr:mediator of DNA damage checkpoint protein 1-like [Penaeus chinensis]
MYAAAFGHREVVLLILAAFKQLHHVAYHGQRNGQGLTASQLAERNGHEDIAALLKVEDAVFPRPAGPSAFIPAHPLDLDRPPTPTETRSIRSSFRRSRAAAKASEPEPPDPTAPLPPPALAKSVKSRGSGKLSSSFKLTSKLVSRDSWDADEEPASTSEAVLSRREGGASRRRDAVLAKSKSIDAIVETGYDPTSARARDRSIVGWETEIEGNREITKKSQREEEKGKTEPVKVAGPDRLEKQVLEELMRGLVVAGSPGSGNEADTESLMECERSAPDHSDDSADAKMSGGNGRKTAVSGPSGGSCSASTSGQAMPKIDLSASSRSLNRSIQHLVQEDTENRPGLRPPTPARPSLPTLLPGRLLDVSLSASVGSTKSEGRSVATSRRVTFSSFPRSASEPRSLTVSPTRNLRPEDDDDDDEDETVMDLLDSSTRSEGWDHIRGARGRGPSCTPSEGHVVPLPPINQPRFSEFGVRGREGIRGRSGLGGGEDTVLNVAKKTLEQLESVLAPSEGAALPRHIPRTRTSQQIHLET